MYHAVVATIKSVLHTSKLYSREYSDTLARSIAQYLIDNLSDVQSAYCECDDTLAIAESFTRDYLVAIKES